MKKTLYQPASGILTLRYLPDSNELFENPPRFSWLPANTENGPYILEISKDESFKKDVLKYEDVTVNFYAPDVALEAGDYFWRYTLANGKYEHSKVRKFTITDDMPKTQIKAKKDRFVNSSMEHPRIWLNAKTLAEFKKELKANPSHCKFDVFMDKAVSRYKDKPLMAEPKPYPTQERVISVWRQLYLDAQEAYNHVKFLSVAGVITEDKEILEQAKKALLEMAAWDTKGPTRRDYNDEGAFRVAGALAWGYDWLYNYMTEDERKLVYAPLVERVDDIEHHIAVSSKIHFSLYDSHAVRSLSSVVVPGSLALLGEYEPAKDWLNRTLDYINVLYTPWGGKDGGWSEGGLYWTTGMAFVIDALNMVKNYDDIDIFKRPFFQNTANYPIYCFSHDTFRASFGDQSCLGSKSILKTGFNTREFAGVTRNGIFQWHFEQVAKRESYDDQRYFNIGWWDFYFDEMMYLANYEPVEAVAPEAGRNVKWFKDIGWVAIHQDMHKEEDHIMLLTKSSPYGSVSHSHGDQNSMVLFAFQEALLIEPGHYIGFNSSMHRNFRKQTKSQNTLLIGGQGQYAEFDKTIQLSCGGQINEVVETEKYVKVSETATKGYLPNVPHLKEYTREIYFIGGEYFVVFDYVALEKEDYVSYLLHTLKKPEFDLTKFEVGYEKANLRCEFAFVSSGADHTTITDEFEGVDPKIIEGLDKQWHFGLHTRKAKSHVIVSMLQPRKADDESTVEVILDDQGHDLFMYFTKDGETFTLHIDGNKRY